MDGVTDGEFATDSKKIRFSFQNTQQEEFVSSVYSAADETTQKEIERLQISQGIFPTCKSGCYHCCGQHILVSIAESQALVHYIQREFSPTQIENLKFKTQQWHLWDELRRGPLQENQGDESLDFAADHYCPVLVNGRCSVYPMRPLICRTHLVSSEPSACRPIHDPQSIAKNPTGYPSVLVATHPYVLQLKEQIEKSGLDYCNSMMLLAHGLAIEMKWDFALPPEFR